MSYRIIDGIKIPESVFDISEDSEDVVTIDGINIPASVFREPDRPDMYRADGSRKSAQGYLGPVKNKADGRTMTELTIDTNVDGVEMQIPTMVPTLTKEEIDILASQNWEGRAKEIPRSIKIKAKDHAQKRISEGKSVFYVDGEDRYVEIDGIKIPKEVVEARDYLDKERQQLSTGVGREMMGGLSFQTADELEALFSPGEYSENLARITAERKEFRDRYPVSSTLVELVGAVPTSFGGASILGRLGVKSLPKQAGIEGAFYGGAAGTTPEERALGAGIGGGAGLALGKGIQVLTKPRRAAAPTGDVVDQPQVGELVNYTRSDGSNVQAKIVGEEGDRFVLTTDVLSDTPSPQKTFKVNKDDPVIGQRFDFDPDDPNVTPIERIPKGEAAPYTPLSARPTQSAIDIVEEEVAGPPLPTSSGGSVRFLDNRRPSNDERTFIDDLATKLFAKETDELIIITENDIKRISTKFYDKYLQKNKDGSYEAPEGMEQREFLDLWQQAQKEAAKYVAKKVEKQLGVKLNDAELLNIDDFFNELIFPPGSRSLAAYHFDGGRFIFLDDTKLTTAYRGYERAHILAHEMGHAASKREFGKELDQHLENWQARKPKKKQTTIVDGEEISVGIPKAKTPLGKKIVDEYLASGHAKLTTQGYTNNNMFEEWVVDSIARYALANAPKAPKGAVKKFFWEVGKSIRELYNRAQTSYLSAFTKDVLKRTGNNESAIRGMIVEFVKRNKQRQQGGSPTRRVGKRGAVEEAPFITPAYREAPRPRFEESIYNPPTGPGWRDATTAGELWDGIKTSMRRTYDRLTPMTDLLQLNVSRQVGARAQRADESATRINQTDFETYVEPIEDIAKQWDDNVELRKQTLLHSDGDLTLKEYTQYIAREFGDDAAKRMEAYLKWSQNKNIRNAKRFGVDTKPLQKDYLHRQRKFKDDAEMNAAMEDEFALPFDPGMQRKQYNIKRELGQGNTGILDIYQNPFFTNTRRIMNNEKLFQYAEKFGVRVDGSLTPDQIITQLGKEMQKRGISAEKASYAVQEIRRNLLGERKMMNQTLQALQTLGYAGTLAGPKSALLNLHDIPQAAVNQGPQAVRAWFQGLQRGETGKLVSDSFGFSQQSKFGEFANTLNQALQTRGGWAKSLNNTANQTTNVLMKASLFQLFDKVGKSSVLRIVQQKAVDDVAREGWQGLQKQWGTYFSDVELKRIANDLQRYGMDDTKYSKEGLRLTEELMMAGLGQQQLISAGGRPAFWADHPNARVFLALRGFAMKQQAVALRNVFQNAKEGNVQDAKDWAIRYALYSMGAFAAINEFRQILFGDGDFSASRVVRSFFDQLVGVASLNSASVSDYSWGKIQRGEFLEYIIDNNIPIAFGVPKEAVEDTLDVMTGEKTIGELPETLPLVKQVKNAERNLQEAMR